MSLIKRRDNSIELALRRQLHAAGLRYRVHYAVPGARRRTIDVAFTRAHLAVFVDGCFWHGCPDHGTKPTSNADWWSSKLSVNVARDVETTRLLEELGWTVLRIWEHDEPAAAAQRVVATLAGVGSA